MIHEILNTSWMGKNKQYNKQFEVVPIGDRRQEASLVLLSAPCTAVRTTTLVGPYLQCVSIMKAHGALYKRHVTFYQ